MDGLEFEWEDNITREQYQQYAGEISNYVAAFVAGAIPGSGLPKYNKGFVRYSLEKGIEKVGMKPLMMRWLV